MVVAKRNQIRYREDFSQLEGNLTEPERRVWEQERVEALVHSHYGGAAEQQLLQMLGFIDSPPPLNPGEKRR